MTQRNDGRSKKSLKSKRNETFGFLSIKSQKRLEFLIFFSVFDSLLMQIFDNLKSLKFEQVHGSRKEIGLAMWSRFLTFIRELGIRGAREPMGQSSSWLDSYSKMGYPIFFHKFSKKNRD